MELDNSIIMIALRTLALSFISTSNPSPSLTDWWLKASLELFMSPMCPCASAWPRGSPCPQSQQGACPDTTGSGSLAGGPRDRCRRKSYRRSWGCQRVNVPGFPVGWTLAAAADGESKMGGHAPVAAKWARTWCLCSGWCWWRGWSPEVGDLHHCREDKHDNLSSVGKWDIKCEVRQREKPGICRCAIQHDITEHSGCCIYVRASGECAFVCKCVTHTKELRAAWPSWCCCHADMEPSESPGELKPCREEISALLRENSGKTKTSQTLWELISATTPCVTEKWARTNSVWYGRGGCFQSEGRGRPDSPAGL